MLTRGKTVWHGKDTKSFETKCYNLFLLSTFTVFLFRSRVYLFRIISFDIRFDKRCVGEGTFGVVHIGIGVVVEQHHRLVLRNDTDGGDQLLELVFQPPMG